MHTPGIKYSSTVSYNFDTNVHIKMMIFNSNNTNFSQVIENDKFQ